MDFENGIILPFWAMAVLKDVQGVLRVAGAASRILDWVRHIRIHLVDDHIHRLVEEPLAGVCKAPRFEGVIFGNDGPFGEDFGVYVGRAPRVVAGVDTLK